MTTAQGGGKVVSLTHRPPWVHWWFTFLGLNKPNIDRHDKDNNGNPSVFSTSNMNCQKATAINALRSSISCAFFIDPHKRKCAEERSSVTKAVAVNMMTRKQRTVHFSISHNARH
jgi:hypothetical protein